MENSKEHQVKYGKCFHTFCFVGFGVRHSNTVAFCLSQLVIHDELRETVRQKLYRQSMHLISLIVLTSYRLLRFVVVCMSVLCHLSVSVYYISREA